MKIATIFPLASIIFTLEKEHSISSSQAQRLKEENKNKLARLESKFDGKIYETHRIVLGSRNNKPIITPISDKILASDFSAITTIAALKADNAWLGQAINYKEIVRNSLVSMTVDEVAEYLELDKPKFTAIAPVMTSKDNATKCDINSFCTFNKAEMLLRNSSLELLTAFGTSNIKTMLELESSASAYGSQIHNDSFLRSLSLASKEQDSETISNDAIIVLVKDVLAYDYEKDFQKTDESLQKSYNELQMNRNGLFKLMKDKARSLQRSYTLQFQKTMATYNTACLEHNKEIQKYTETVENYRTELLQEIASLRLKNN